MACPQFIARLFVIVLCLCSTCSFKNNHWWTSSGENKLSPDLKITGTLYFCSQASSLTSPVMEVLMPPLPAIDSSDESMENLPPPLPTVSNMPTIYIGSRSSNLFSPVIELYNTRLSFFEHILFLICLMLLMATVTATLAAWMLLSIPLLSYITVSSFCEAFGLPPIFVLKTLKTKLNEVYHFESSKEFVKALRTVKLSMCHSQKDKGKQLFIHLPCGQILSYKLRKSILSCATCVPIVDKLKRFVCCRTGIPRTVINFLYQNKQIRTNRDIELLPMECNIHLKLGLLGGQECDMCGGTDAIMYCGDCNQLFCVECCSRVHSHPKRMNHHPSNTGASNSISTENLSQASSTSEATEDDIFCSQSNISFHDAMLIATLAEKFGLTTFKNFQKKIIDSTLEGRDTLVIHPTGSGKSLCFQFPPIFQDKKAFIITPTISLMQDQVYGLQQKGIKTTFLGSAQPDKQAEGKALDPNSDVYIVFVTPEWIAKPENVSRVQGLAAKGKLSLLAIDEAHLVSEWSDFRKAYTSLETLHTSFRNTPIMALTATATPKVEDDIKKLLRNPVVSKSSINRPNITLSATELVIPPNSEYFQVFASHVADISNSEPTIVYTDFISDIGPIVSSLSDLGIEAVGYYGEMDPRERQESYLRWKSGQVNVMVATKAFGMGINKSDIRHVIRNGVPESVISWTQEFGRAGRDGLPSTATILYTKSDVRHANAWIWNNVSNPQKCESILSDFSTSWRFVEAHLAGSCRRNMLLELFGESHSQSSGNTHSICCDVCTENQQTMQPFNEELKILVDALRQIGQKGELKVVEWIRGSSVSWTNAYNKKAFSYGNHKGHTLEQWRLFMRQCHVLGLIKHELKSMIKGNGHYSVMGVYYPLEKSEQYLNDEQMLMLPSMKHYVDSSSTTVTSESSTSIPEPSTSTKRKRIGKGSNILSVVRKLLTDQENWKSLTDKKDYHFLGTFPKSTEQHLYYIPDCTSLQQASSSNPHFLWNDVQLSKSNVNKDRLIQVEIGDSKESVFYRSASCLGVKVCPEIGCNYTAPIREKRNCKTHTHQKLVRSESCPVELVYIYPQQFDKDHRRWIGGIVRNQKVVTDNLHNHTVHGPFKICDLVRDKISEAVHANVSLTPTDISRGKGVGFLPSAVDAASSHLGRVAREVTKTKDSLGVRCTDWSPCSLESVADDVDGDDLRRSDDSQQQTQYREQGRPYLVSAGVESGIKYAFAMSPLMSKMLSTAEFLQSDITYNENSVYPYLFNAVVFNDVTMEWMVVARVWLSTQSEQGYRLAYKKMFDHCKEQYSDFDVGKSLQAIVIDWSDAEINGLKAAIGEKLAMSLLRGCKVHWLRSCQRVADRVASPENKNSEKNIFLCIAGKIQFLKSAVDTIACFETLCGVRSVAQLVDKLPDICSKEEAKSVDLHKNWSGANSWAQWWTRSTHLKMLSAAFTEMDKDIWKRSPTTTNAVERKNRDCKSDAVSIKQIMTETYKLDKVVCMKHITAIQGSSISYRSKSAEARAAQAKYRQKCRSMRSEPDKDSKFGPPDKASNFNKAVPRKRQSTSVLKPGHSKKTCIEIDQTKVQFVPNPRPEVIGKEARMKFHIQDSDTCEWFNGIVSSYDGITQKYSIYFPSDEQTVLASLDDEDLELVE